MKLEKKNTKVKKISNQNNKSKIWYEKKMYGEIVKKIKIFSNK
jgi:hypothetical protein